MDCYTAGSGIADIGHLSMADCSAEMAAEGLVAAAHPKCFVATRLTASPIT